VWLGDFDSNKQKPCGEEMMNHVFGWEGCSLSPTNFVLSWVALGIPPVSFGQPAVELARGDRQLCCRGAGGNRQPRTFAADFSPQVANRVAILKAIR
jgi:hypothetical protein